MDNPTKKPRIITDKRKEQNRIHQARYRQRRRVQQHDQSQPLVDVTSYALVDCVNASLGEDLVNDTDRLGDSYWDYTNAFQAQSYDVTTDGLSSTLSPQDNDMLMSHSISPFLNTFSPQEVHRTADDPGYGIETSYYTVLEDGTPQRKSDGTPCTSAMLDLSSVLGPHPSDGGQNLLVPQRPYVLEMLKTSIEFLVKQKSFSKHSPPLIEAGADLDPELDGNDQDVFERCLSGYSLELRNKRCDRHSIDLYANHLRMDLLNLLAACSANAFMLGIPLHLEPQQYNEHHSHKNGRYVSPFWLAMRRLGSVTAVIAHYAYLSRDLQPWVEQIENKHALYIDFLPFPEFRRRLLVVQRVEPPIFDENDLCDDIDRGGLVCWGSQGSGTPWDMRSWEAKPWFLKKWWMLTGDETGEMWRQSKWYWDLQGIDY